MRPAAPSLAVSLSLLALAGGGAQAHAQPAGPTRTALVETAHRSGAVARCWNAFIQSQPEAGSARFRVRIEVDANGSFHRVTVLDPVPVALAGCVRTQLGQLSVASGAALSVETTYNFAAGMPAPVPASTEPASRPATTTTTPPPHARE